MKYLAPTLAALLTLAACGGGSGSDSGATEELETDMVATMVRHGLDGETAACVADDLANRLTPSMYAEVTAAASAADIPLAWQPAVSDASAICSGGAPAEAPASAADTAPASDAGVTVDDSEPEEPTSPSRSEPDDAEG